MFSILLLQCFNSSTPLSSFIVYFECPLCLWNFPGDRTTLWSLHKMVDIIMLCRRQFKVARCFSSFSSWIKIIAFYFWLTELMVILIYWRHVALLGHMFIYPNIRPSHFLLNLLVALILITTLMVILIYWRHVALLGHMFIYPNIRPSHFLLNILVALILITTLDLDG